MKYSLYLIISFFFIVPSITAQTPTGKNPFVPRTQPVKEISKPNSDKIIPQDTLCSKSGSVRKTDFAHAIDMLGFEKRLNDRTETFMLQNNTENLVTRVKLKIIYRTPNGRMIDYREVMIEGEILPHTTRQFEIESFDKGKRYYFHKSTGGNKKLEGYPFHIQFSLLRYDIAITQ